MRLARRIGLVAYWMQVERWPDFCESRDLPYSCSAEAARTTVHTTGLGGGPSGKFTAVECSNGYVVGFAGRAGAWIAQISPLCASWRASLRALGPLQEASTTLGDSAGGYPHRKTCPQGMAVRVLHISAVHDSKDDPTYVAFVEAECATLTSPADSDRLDFGYRPRAKLGSPFFPVQRRRFLVSCPDGEFATDLIGRSDYFVDALGLVCAPAPAA